MSQLREVSKEEFWGFIKTATFDIVSSIERGPYPYTSLFKTRNGGLVGKIVESYAGTDLWPVISTYFLSVQG